MFSGRPHQALCSSLFLTEASPTRRCCSSSLVRVILMVQGLRGVNNPMLSHQSRRVFEVHSMAAARLRRLYDELHRIRWIKSERIIVMASNLHWMNLIFKIQSPFVKIKEEKKILWWRISFSSDVFFLKNQCNPGAFINDVIKFGHLKKLEFVYQVCPRDWSVPSGVEVLKELLVPLWMACWRCWWGWRQTYQHESEFLTILN